MRTSLAFVVGTALLIAAPREASAQNNEPLAVGTRIRFTVADIQSADDWSTRRMSMRGTLIGVRGDSLVVRFGGTDGQLTMPRLAMGDLSVSMGSQRGWRAQPGRVAIRGLLTAASGVLLAQMIRIDHTGHGTARSSATPLMAASVALNAVSFATFALHRTERWERVRATAAPR